MESGLRDQVNQLSARLKQITKELRVHQRAHRAAEVRAEEPALARTGAWAYDLLVGLIVWSLREDSDLAAQCATRCKGKRSQTPAWTPLEIEKRGLALTAQKKFQLLNPSTPRGRRALTEAHKLCAEFGLYRWVRHQNDSKGLAPSKRALWRQWSDSSDISQAEPVARMGTYKRGQNLWMQRWAHRWRVMQGRFKQGERLPVEILRAKAEI